MKVLSHWLCPLPLSPYSVQNSKSRRVMWEKVHPLPLDFVKNQRMGTDLGIEREQESSVMPEMQVTRHSGNLSLRCCLSPCRPLSLHLLCVFHSLVVEQVCLTNLKMQSTKCCEGTPVAVGHWPSWFFWHEKSFSSPLRLQLPLLPVEWQSNISWNQMTQAI